MNRKGFTLVELITTFALAAVIIVLLINTVVIIKKIYYKSDLKTELYINQGNLSNAMNKLINRGNLQSYSVCNDSAFCYSFTISNVGNVKLIVSSQQIIFGDFSYKLPDSAIVENPSVTTEYVSGVSVGNDSFLIIKIPIKVKEYPDKDFGINLIYPYNSREIYLGV